VVQSSPVRDIHMREGQGRSRAVGMGNQRRRRVCVETRRPGEGEFLRPADRSSRSEIPAGSLSGFRVDRPGCCHSLSLPPSLPLSLSLTTDDIILRRDYLGMYDTSDTRSICQSDVMDGMDYYRPSACASAIRCLMQAVSLCCMFPIAHRYIRDM
jgi:hypothetical protein